MIHKKTTKEILGESLSELAETQSVDRITVREIAANSSLSTATFYHHFRDKFDLIAWIYNCQMEDIFRDYCEGRGDWRKTVQDLILILDRDRRFYVNVLTNTCGQNSFYESTHVRSIELLTAVLRERAGEQLDDELLFDARFYLQGIGHSAVDWLLRDQPMTVGHLADYLCRAMPERLKPYLS